MKKIIIETIPHTEQNYETTGDWHITEDTITIRVSEVNNWKGEFLVGLHELIEVALCLDRNISEEAVTTFDISHPELEDPGIDPQAPYFKEHAVAVRIEQEIAKELNIDWEEHTERLYQMHTPPER
jgi:hypothetical protein